MEAKWVKEKYMGEGAGFHLHVCLMKEERWLRNVWG